MHLGGLNYEVAKLIKNKCKVRQRLLEAKVDDMEQAYEVNGNTDIDSLLEKLSFPVMVKPCDGSGSRGVSRVDKASQFADACKKAMASSITHRAEVERFIEGREYGAEGFVVNGEVHVFGIMRKWMTEPPYFAELGHALPTDLSSEVEERAKQCVESAIKTLGINFGAVNMDLLITADDKVHIIDIGARMGGNMIGPCVIPYGTGIDYVANMIRHAVGDKVDFTANGYSTVATRLLAFGDGVVKQLPDFKKMEKDYGVEIYHHLEVGQTISEYHTNLDGCGYIIAKADNIETAIARADKVLNLIEKEIFR
jgi:biotin carboxylase